MARRSRGRATARRERALPRRLDTEGAGAPARRLDSGTTCRRGELVRFGQIVRDLYGGPLHATARARPGAEFTYAPPDGARSDALILSRTTPADGIVRERVSSPVEERITLRTRATGFEAVETTFRLVRGVRRLDVTSTAPEGADRGEGERSHRLPVCRARPVRHLRADRRRRRRRIGPRQRGARPRDSPLGRHPGRLRGRRLEHARGAARPARERLPPVPALPCDDRRRGSRPGLLRAIRACSHGTLDGAVPDNAVSSSPPAADARSLGIATADALTRPLAGVLEATPRGGRTVCELDAPGVEVVMLAAGAGGESSSAPVVRRRRRRRPGRRRDLASPGRLRDGARRARRRGA